MICEVENQIITEKCYTNRPKISIYLKNAEISPCEIRFLLDYIMTGVNMPSQLPKRGYVAREVLLPQ